MNNSLVNLQGISKYFSNGQLKTHALQEVSLTIERGEFIAITGPSGCGKSSLLNILGLLDTPNDGQYQLADINMSDLSVDQRAKVRNQHIGFVFQSFNLIDSLTVFENIALPLEQRGTPKKHIQQKVNNILKAVNLDGRADYYPKELSGGQQQRVSIARALVGEPDLLLVDEPTGNLDSQNGDAVMQLLLSLNQQGTTVVMVTHDERYSQMAKRQIRLFDGKVILEHKEAAA